ncbi:hypothetical protein V6N13_139596 [Hibiscus sabdariffa]
MGASGKWEKVGSWKWKLWSSSPWIDACNAAMAALVQASAKDFRVLRKEWAAIRIQDLMFACCRNVGKKGFGASKCRQDEETGCINTSLHASSHPCPSPC